MKMPRAAIVWRVLIYGSLIAFFGTRAVQKYVDERNQRAAAEAQETELEGTKRTITLPDGSTQEILEVSPEQAERMFGAEFRKSAGAPAPPSIAGESEGTGLPAPELPAKDAVGSHHGETNPAR